MKKTLYTILVPGLMMACQSGKKEKALPEQPQPVYTRVELRTDTLNLVKTTDTMVIYESVCRGCEYEHSASFSVVDSLGLVELYTIETADNNPPDVDGGSLQKYILLVPRKTGTTRLKLYSFLEQPPTAEDSSRFKEYMITVQQ
jgi:hypothetical protein